MNEWIDILNGWINDCVDDTVKFLIVFYLRIKKWRNDVNNQNNW